MTQEIKNNLKIIYCSYPILNADGEPAWVASVAQDPMFRDNGFCFYRPYISLAEHFRDDSFFMSLQTAQVNEKLKTNAAFLKLDNICFESMEKAGSMLNATDVALPLNQNVLKDVFCLARSSLLISDCSQASFGETAVEFMLASFGDIPTIALTDKYVNSPWFLNYATVVSQILEKKKLLNLLNGLVKS